MRFFLCVLALCSLAFAPSAHAGDTAALADNGALAWREPSEAVRLGRKLAMGQANLRASGLVAMVLIGSGPGGGAAERCAVSEQQRDAVLAVLLEHNYFERLARLYAWLFNIEDLREVAAMYARPSIASLWQFYSAAVVTILSLGVNMEVELPESTLQPSAETGDKNAMAARDSIAQLLAFWFPGLLGTPIDQEALVTGIQAHTTRDGIDEALALSQTPAARKLSMAHAHPKFDAFNYKEWESPRLRNAVTDAVLRTK